MLMSRKQVLREMILDGVIAIVERTNPRVLEANLAVYSNRPQSAPAKKLVAM
jgi:flagellar motor component MotA